MSAQKNYQHPFIIRATHWLNFLALTIMIMSGLRIYNASPIFPFLSSIPDNLTLGGWLGGARQWHFLGMWILGKVLEVAPVGFERVRRSSTLGGQHVEVLGDLGTGCPGGVAAALRPAQRLPGCSFEAGMVTLISRGVGWTKCASANMAA